MFFDPVTRGSLSPIDLFAAFVVQDQLHERRVITEEADDAVIAGAEETAFVSGIVREKAAAFGDIEMVREHGREARKSSFIAAALCGGNYQIGVSGAGFRGESGPARSSFLMKTGVFRNFGNNRRRVSVVAKRLRIAFTAVRRILLQFPVEQGLGTRRQAFHHRGSELPCRVAAGLHDKVSHFNAFRA